MNQVFHGALRLRWCPEVESSQQEALAKECAFPEELTGTPPVEVQSEPGKEIVFSMLEPEQLNHYVRFRKN